MSDRAAPIVVALGGNAISPSGVVDSISNQFAQTRRSAAAIADLLLGDAPVVLTHGNGPQVGDAVRRVELAADEVYQIPLGILVADLQGGIGYMMAQCFTNELKRRGSSKSVSTLITNVLTDGDDPAFEHPTKPIGPCYDATEAARLRAAGWVMVEIPPNGFRRVVPSPRPRAILEIDLIKRLVEDGELIITVGGGGVPVVREADGSIHGRDAVIDKDLASALLACELDASLFLLLTAIPQVYLDFGQPTQRGLDRLTLDEARGHLDDGQFPPGSMGPKISAAIEFLDQSRRAEAKVLIGDLFQLHELLRGEAGTVITRDASPSPAARSAA